MPYCQTPSPSSAHLWRCIPLMHTSQHTLNTQPTSVVTPSPCRVRREFLLLPRLFPLSACASISLHFQGPRRQTAFWGPLGGGQHHLGCWCEHCCAAALVAVMPKPPLLCCWCLPAGCVSVDVSRELPAHWRRGCWVLLLKPSRRATCHCQMTAFLSSAGVLCCWRDKLSCLCCFCCPVPQPLQACYGPLLGHSG